MEKDLTVAIKAAKKNMPIVKVRLKPVDRAPRIGDICWNKTNQYFTYSGNYSVVEKVFEVHGIVQT